MIEGFPAQPDRCHSLARTVSFSFDDGPHREWTLRVLERLARCDVAATFFVVGERVRAEPELVRAVVAAGHDVQLHCHRHIRHSELGELELARDTEQALAALDAVGVRPRLWRPPWGVCTDASRAVARRHGLRLVRWAIDTHDWRGDTPRRMLAVVCPSLPHGGSILMHDALGPGSERTGCENTLALLPALAAAARGQRLAIAPMIESPGRSAMPPAAETQAVVA